jgi:CRP/FNR family transcriptional regulator, cyclic AMP receptor protein
MERIFASLKKSKQFQGTETVFAQGEEAKNIMYIQEGGVKLTVVNEAGREAVVAILGRGDLLGEGCLMGQSIYMATATAIAPTTVFCLEKNEMLRLLHQEPEFCDFFIAYMLERNARVEEDLIGHLLNSSEKRLACMLLRLADCDTPGDPQTMPPGVSQELLAEMIGTTRPRVSLFMNKFRRLGLIDYGNKLCSLHINKSLRNFALQD